MCFPPRGKLRVMLNRAPGNAISRPRVRYAEPSKFKQPRERYAATVLQAGLTNSSPIKSQPCNLVKLWQLMVTNSAACHFCSGLRNADFARWTLRSRFSVFGFFRRVTAFNGIYREKTQFSRGRRYFLIRNFLMFFFPFTQLFISCISVFSL